MKNFVILNKLGNFVAVFLIISTGEGAFSTVHKVRRVSDGQIYALKMVTYFYSLSLAQLGWITPLSLSFKKLTLKSE
jgi:hypothetical protein